MSTGPEPGQRHGQCAPPRRPLSGQDRLPGAGRLLVAALAALFVVVSALGVLPSRAFAQASGIPQAEEEPSEFEQANDAFGEAQDEATPEEREQESPGGDSGDEAPDDEGGGDEGPGGSSDEGSGDEESSEDDQTEYGQAQDDYSDALEDASEEREQATPGGGETENGEAQERADEEADEGGGEDDEGGDSERGCGLSPESSYAFQILSPKDVDHDRSYMVCGVGNYYLTYVDFSNILQQANPVPDMQDTTYNGFNGLASLAFELNAQMMAMTIDLLNFALDLNLVETLKSSIDRVVDALGEGFYAVLYTAASVVALVYVMYLFAKGRAQDAGFALIKASFVAFIGLWLTGGQAVAVADSVNGYQESLTNAAFSALTDINEDDQSSEALGCDSAEQCISANIWDRYVYDPWANLQISEDGDIAEKERDRILKISNPDDREQELKDLGNSNDEVKSVVDMVYATGHFLKAVLQLVVSAFFSFLVFTLVFCLIAAEIMMVFFIMTAPIWMVAAIIPAGMLFERFVFYTLVEAAQVFGYKILIAIHLLFMNAIMTNFGTATGYLIACVLTVAAFVKRKTLYKLLSPTGLARTLEARYRRGRQIRADAASARGGGMLAGGGAGGGSAAAAGTAAATGVPASGARPVRQSFTEAKAQMEANSFTPEGLRSGAAVVGAAGAGAAYRGAAAAPGAVREGSDARAEEAMRLHELARKRADDPESLSDGERRELEQSEAMSSAGNDPLARASIANRDFVKDAKERRRHRNERNGLSTNAALAGPRRDGESERSYLARQKEARRQANEQRRNLSDMAKNRQGFNMGGYPQTVSCTSCGKPFTASSAADTVCSVCQRHGSNHGVKTNKCAGCGTMLADPNQTLCSRCRGGGGPGGSGGGPGDVGPGPTGRARPGPGGPFYASPGTGQRPPRFTTSPDGTVSDSGGGDSGGGSRSSGEAAPSESYEDGSPSETVGRPRATDAGASDGGYDDGGYEDGRYEGTSYDDRGYEGSSATDGAPAEGGTADDRFVGFGHTDPSHGAPVDGEGASATAGQGEYTNGNDRGVSGPDGFYGPDGSGYYADSYDESGVRRPRGFEATNPGEPADGGSNHEADRAPVEQAENTGDYERGSTEVEQADTTPATPATGPDSAESGGVSGEGNAAAQPENSVEDSGGGSYDESAVQRPRGFVAANPTEPTTSERTTTERTTGEPEPAGEPMEPPAGKYGGGESRISSESGDSVSEDTAFGGRHSEEGRAAEEVGISEGERPSGTEGYGPDRPRRAQKFSAFGHTALDAAGYIPAAGAVPDLVNAGWYTAEGNRRDAAISAGAAVPVVGDSGKAIADAGKAAKAAKIHARADRIERGIDQARQTSPAGGGKSGAEGGLPGSVRPKRFSQDRGSGLWLPRGSNTDGPGSRGGAAQSSAGGDSLPADSGEKFAESALQSGAGAAGAQRPPTQRSEGTPSGDSRQSSTKGTPSEETASGQSSAREGSSKESPPEREAGTTGASGEAGHRPNAESVPSEPESRPARTEVKPSGADRSGNSPGTGSGAQRPSVQGSAESAPLSGSRSGGQSRTDAVGLPDSLRPERFSRDQGSGLWLAKGSGATQRSAGGREPGSASPARSSAESSAENASPSGSGSAEAQRPPTQRSEGRISENRQPGGGSSPGRESSAMESSAMESFGKKEPESTDREGDTARKPEPSEPEPSRPDTAGRTPSEPESAEPSKPQPTPTEARSAEPETGSHGFGRGGDQFQEPTSGTQRGNSSPQQPQQPRSSERSPGGQQSGASSKSDGSSGGSSSGSWLSGGYSFSVSANSFSANPITGPSSGTGSSSGSGPSSVASSSAGSGSENVQRPAPDTSRGGREDSSRQSQRRTNEGRGNDRTRDNS